MKFIDKMEELDDVQNVFSNFEIDDAIASELEECYNRISELEAKLKKASEQLDLLGD